MLPPSWCIDKHLLKKWVCGPECRSAEHCRHDCFEILKTSFRPPSRFGCRASAHTVVHVKVVPTALSACGCPNRTCMYVGELREQVVLYLLSDWGKRFSLLEKDLKLLVHLSPNGLRSFLFIICNQMINGFCKHLNTFDMPCTHVLYEAHQVSCELFWIFRCRIEHQDGKFSCTDSFKCRGHLIAL